MEAAAWAVGFVEAVATVVLVVVATVAVARVVGAASGLACSTKVGQVVFPSGLSPCP